MKNVSINLVDDNQTNAPLFHQYPMQLQAQPAYLEIYPGNCEDEIKLDAEYNGNISGGISGYVADRIAYRFSLPNRATRSAIEGLCEDQKFVKLINNFVSADNEERSEIEQEIDEHLSQIEQASIWGVGEWLEYSTALNEDENFYSIDGDKITAETSDEELKAIAEKLKEQESTDSDQVVIGDYLEFLQSLREELI